MLDLSNQLNLLEQRQQVFKEKHQDKKVEHSYQELGIEMQQFFKKNIWYLFYKYDEDYIRQAFDICKRKDINKVPYLIGIIKHKYNGF